MRKAFNLNEGDKVIYVRGYVVKESVVVKEPIDGKERPLFRIGRIDLKNGDYLINGTYVYDDIEEAKNDVLGKVQKDLDGIDEKISFYQEMKKVTELAKKQLLNNVKVESQI